MLRQRPELLGSAGYPSPQVLQQAIAAAAAPVVTVGLRRSLAGDSPADNGFVMKTRWQGTNSDTGAVMGFYSYSFVDTDDDGQVTRWETHVNSEYSDFLDVAIGVHGPFHGTHEYTDALERRLAEEGVTV